jgi:4-hydroxy-tetrahydrodipicolinate reductase
MKVGLIGFGKTGKAVASVVLENPDIRLEWVIRKSHKLEHRSVPEFLGVESSEPGLIYSSGEFSADELLDNFPVDAIIDFSAESGVDYYGTAAAKREISIVSAISKVSDEYKEQLRSLSKTTRVMWSPNITVGVNFLMIAAKVLQSIAPGTDIEIIEEHFRDKIEVSGTAVRIANELGLDDRVIRSIRAGGIIGTHEILFGFPFQTVRLKHESISREAFGRGAVFALEHLQHESIGLYRMEDLMKKYFENSDQ